MTSADIARIGTAMTTALTAARAVMASHGHETEVRDSLDMDAQTAVFEVVASDVVVYRILLDFADYDASAIIGRAVPEGLRALGLGTLADREQRTAESRAS